MLNNSETYQELYWDYIDNFPTVSAWIDYYNLPANEAGFILAIYKGSVRP
jgi:hypothetical protein